MKKFLEGVGLGTLVTGGVGIVMFIEPILRVVLGWFMGLVLVWIFGSYITDGMNLIFGVDRFDKSQLPMICATLAAVGGFFKSHQTNNNKK